MNHIPFSHARAHFAQTLSDVESARKPTVISRRGRPSVVLMSVAQYERLGGAQEAFSSKLASWRKRNEDVLKDDATDPWAGVRDTSTGRADPW